MVLPGWTKIQIQEKYSCYIRRFATRYGWVVSFTPQPLYLLGRSHQCPFNRRLVGPQSWRWCFGEQKNLFALKGMEPRFLGFPGRRLVTIPIILFRLSKIKIHKAINSWLLCFEGFRLSHSLQNIDWACLRKQCKDPIAKKRQEAAENCVIKRCT